MVLDVLVWPVIRSVTVQINVADRNVSGAMPAASNCVLVDVGLIMLMASPDTWLHCTEYDPEPFIIVADMNVLVTVDDGPVLLIAPGMVTLNVAIDPSMTQRAPLMTRQRLTEPRR